MRLLDRTARLVVGHRGDRAHAPENTIAAFERALGLGVDALECDVRLTSDGALVVHHDETINRTTSGRGAVAELSLAEIQRCDAGARWSAHAIPEIANGGMRNAETPFANAGHRVPTLAEALEAFPSTEFIVEIKTIAASAAVADLVKTMRATERILIGAFDHPALAAPRAAGLATLASRREMLQLLPAVIAGSRPAGRLPFAAMSMTPRYYGLPVPISRFVQAANLPVHVWTVNDPREARRYWREGVQAILTDNPAPILAARASENR